MSDVDAFLGGVVRNMVTAPAQAAGLPDPSSNTSPALSAGEALERDLAQALRSGDSTRIFRVVDRLLDPEQVSVAEFQAAVEAAGGEEAFREKIVASLQKTDQLALARLGSLSGKGPLELRIKRRLKGDKTVLGEIAETFDPTTVGGGLRLFAATSIPGAAPLIVGQDVLRSYLDEVLLIAKELIERVSNALIETNLPGMVLTATVLQSIGDIFVPGSSLDVVLTIVPVGKVAVLLKPILLKAASAAAVRFLGRGVAELVPALLKFMREIVEKHIGRFMSGTEVIFANAFVQAQSASKKLQAEAAHFIEFVSQQLTLNSEFQVASASKKAAKKAALSLAKRNRLAKQLMEFFATPVDRVGQKHVGAKTRFIVNEDGTVLQEIEATLFKNTKGRNVTDLPERALSQGIVPPEGHHLSHVIASIKGGDDELYNLLLCPARVNVSFFKLFDNLEPGRQLKVYIQFDDVEHAYARAARNIRYEDAATGNFIGGLEKLLEHPPMTKREIQKLAIDYINRLEALPSRPEVDLLILRLQEILSS
ncbi:hypothetical protein [Roseibium suaedae]|uniref:Uncharacterized protein n=1 Tax=Roseibium suaedae TaxID=735517 RepID=A0A1M7G196_9HYPH|nr:hypothetical protein [Roseibium suaedae]SHM09986.1 hypothetical protein SAMN05444272_1775 [Roseibium suaedae]